jgi:hypothetical protein
MVRSPGFALRSLVTSILHNKNGTSASTLLHYVRPNLVRSQSAATAAAHGWLSGLLPIATLLRLIRWQFGWQLFGSGKDIASPSPAAISRKNVMAITSTWPQADLASKRDWSTASQIRPSGSPAGGVSAAIDG